MLKDFQVDLELSPKDNRVIQTGATYWSHDVNTAKIVVNLKRNSEPIILSSTVSVRMIMVFDDNDTQKKQVHKMTIDDTQNGVVSLILPKETLGFVGNVLCGVYVNYGENQSTDNGYFTFSMRRSLIDGEFPQLENGYVSEFQTMLDYMIETASEFDNVEEELNKRINVIEKDIASNEVAKQSDVDKLNKSINNYEISRRNLIIGERVTPGLWINEEGTELQSVKNAFTSDFILVASGQDYTATQKYLQLHTVMCVSAYDKDKNFIKMLTSSNDQFHTFKINDNNIKYIRYSGKSSTSNYEDGIKLEASSIPTYWLPSPKDVESMRRDIEILKKAITNLGGTL